MSGILAEDPFGRDGRCGLEILQTRVDCAWIPVCCGLRFLDTAESQDAYKAAFGLPD